MFCFNLINPFNAFGYNSHAFKMVAVHYAHREGVVENNPCVFQGLFGTRGMIPLPNNYCPIISFFYLI